MKREKLGALGTYPKVSIKEARSMRDEHKRILEGKIAPTVLKRQEKIKLQERVTDAFKNIAL